MTLARSTKVGPYEIAAPLGAGGMGEVYRARDTRLGRDVALKVLPEAFARDSERMARFEREAKVLASLNHPNIAAIYGLEDSNRSRALIMELVEGPTLAERIERGALPLDEALSIALQIAEALEYAHERGIIHRDLKPANIKLTSDGKVKVLDFGLAKALEGETTRQELQNSPTLTAVATQAGVLLGTAAYMSPEQARGKPVDRRADIWAFGCVLYEMFARQTAFTGETTSDTVASIIRAEPNWPSLPSSVPRRIRELLRRCLQKDPRQRLQAIGEARIAIQEALSGSAIPEGPAADRTEQISWRSRGAWIRPVMGVALGALLAGLVGWYLRPGATAPPITRFAFAFKAPGGQSLAGFPMRDFPTVAISPDGKELAYVGGERTQVYLRPMDRLEAQAVPGSENATSPFFSPDSEWIGFFANGKLKKASIHGGEPESLCDAPINRGATWGPDNTIVFAPNVFGGLMRVSAAGGPPVPFSTPDLAKKGELSHRWPQFLPGGKAVVFVIATAKDVGFFSQSEIAVQRVDTHEAKILPIRGTYPRYSSTGHLLFAREGHLFAVPFDGKRLQVTGQPMPVLDSVRSSPNSGVTNFMVSDTGVLAYLPEDASAPEGSLVWVDRYDHTKAIPAPARAYGSSQISPDGTRLALSIFSGNNVDVWVFDIPHGTLTRLTFDEHSTAPVWSPDGKQIAFFTTRQSGPGILRKAADGSGAEEFLASGKSMIEIPTSWSPDGKFLAYWTVGTDTGRDIWLLPMTGERKPRPFLQTKFNEQQAVFSPDGRWIAYTSDESGSFEVYVQPFPGPGGKWQISGDGGDTPVWAHNGRELFFVSSDKLMSVSVTTHPGFGASTPRMVAHVPPALAIRLGNNRYDVSPDGERFLFVKTNLENGPPAEIDVVLNWSEELKRIASAGAQP
ncbi:MAG TPA: protein kinase [Terriglobales bacterium]|nr:protein kinase [Terriglobales bacterium]